MLDKFSEAVSLFKDNFVLFTSMVLTIWLPGNLLTEYYSFYAPDESGIMIYLRYTVWVEAILSPIYIGGMIYALSRLKNGEPVTYKKAMSEGLRNWGALFKAHFFAGILIVLGLVAFIIPGIMLAVRWVFIDAAVVLENEDTTGSRRRSAELTEGIRGEIFGVGVLFFFWIFAISFLAGIPLALIPSFNNFVVSTLFNSAIDVLSAVISIIFFLYYWEAVAPETEREDGSQN